MRSNRLVLLAILGTILAGPGSHAQESSSKPAGVPVVANSPAAALRGVLAAACSQSQSEFVKFLTARNKEAFSRMTPAARVALMKRFVLLNEPGKPTSTTNPSGRPIVRCATPEVTTEMQIGGTDFQENLAFLPMELRNATDSVGEDVRQITMGLVREEGQWKLLSVGLLLLDLPALEVEWDAAEMESTEAGAIESLKKIKEAVEAYRRKYFRLPDSLASLAPPLHSAASADAAGLIDSEHANGMKNGYALRYVIAGASAIGAPAKYELSAVPLNYGRTGKRSFFLDTNGVLHGADRKGAVGSESDPKVN